MTKRTLSATMLYMSALALTSAGVRGNPEKIQGNELYTQVIKPNPHDITDEKEVKATTEAFNSDFDEALDAGWHETVADALEAETAEPDVEDVDTADQMQAAIEENDELKEQVVTLTAENEAMSDSLKAALSNNEEGTAALEAVTKERDDALEAVKKSDKAGKAVQKQLNTANSEADEAAEAAANTIKKLKADLEAATAPKAE